MNDEEMKNIYGFFVAASEACGDKRGIVAEFECPVCHEKAHAIRSTYNGHLHAKCEECGCSIME